MPDQPRRRGSDTVRIFDADRSDVGLELVVVVLAFEVEGDREMIARCLRRGRATKNSRIPLCHRFSQLGVLRVRIKESRIPSINGPPDHFWLHFDG